jgi:hypothetical protein
VKIIVFSNKMEDYDLSEEETQLESGPIVPRLFTFRENYEYPLCSNAVND